MFIMIGIFRVDPSEVNAYLDARKAYVARSRTETGCVEFTYAGDPTEPGRIVVTQVWATRDDWDAHLAAKEVSMPYPDKPALVGRATSFYEAAPTEHPRND